MLPMEENYTNIVEWSSDLEFRQLTTHDQSNMPAISLDSIEHHFIELPTASIKQRSCKS